MNNTPQYLPDYENNCLREQPRMKEPDHLCIGAFLYVTEQEKVKYDDAHSEYRKHIASLKTIPFTPGTRFPDGLLEERKNFVVASEFLKSVDGWKECAYPIPVKEEPIKEERMFTLEEMVEAFEAGGFCYLDHTRVAIPKNVREDYFKSKFNITL